MALQVKIDSVDKTSLIEWQSFTIEDNVNDEVNLCAFTIKKYGDRTYTPTIGMEVEVTDGADLLFAGTILKIDNTVDKGVISYGVLCKDYTSELSRILVTDRYEDMTVGEIIESIIDDYNPNVTYANVDCGITVETIAFNKMPIDKCIQLLAEQVNYSWYIDYEKDIHFFNKNTEQAIYNLATDSNNFIYDSLTIDNDNSQLKNRIVVRGGDKVATNNQTKSHTTDGTHKTFNTDFKFSSKPTVTLGGSAQTVGTEFLDTTGYDCYWNFTEKYIRYDTAPTTGQALNITAKPYIPIIVEVEDSGSISTYGAYEYLKIDKSIKSSEEAKQYAQAQLENYGKSLRNGSFRTYNAGLISGQTIEINIPSRGIADTFVIQRITTSMISPTEKEFTVEIALLRYVGIIKFLQDLIINETKKIELNEDEVLEKAYNIYETMEIAEEIEQRAKQTNTETISVAEYIAREPSTIDFVLAPYTPTGTTDPKREFKLDRSLLE